MAVDIDLLTRAYFCFDEPVKYTLKDKNTIYIRPFMVKDTELFLSSVDVFTIDKNAMPSVEIIQMSYLEFILNMALSDKAIMERFLFVLLNALGVKQLMKEQDDFGKPFLYVPELKVTITPQDFEDIKKIILYQNIVGYDDSYINPEIKQAMAEYDSVSNRNIVPPSLERKMAIITAHCGISKKEQMEMTMRSHSMLFQEVVGEVEFSTTRSVALFSGEGSKIEHWIYPKKKDKYGKYFTDVDTYSNSMGGDKGAIKTTDGNISEAYQQMYDNFNRK